MKITFASNKQTFRSNIQTINQSRKQKETDKMITRLAKGIEEAPSKELKDIIFNYHETTKKIITENQDKNNMEYHDDKQDIDYSCMHDFHTIMISQYYTGIPYDNNVYYKGYPNGRIPNWRHQNAFIYPQSPDKTREIKYEFRDYNLTDEVGCCDVLIKDDKIKRMELKHDMLSDIGVEYFYKNGKIQSAELKIYAGKETDKKNAILEFDENEKVKRVHYGISPKTQEEEIYEKDNDGIFRRTY